MAIVVGYVSTPEGRAALERATAEARHLDTTLVVVRSDRGGPTFDQKAAIALEADLEALKKQLGAAHVAHEVHSFVRGNDPAEDIIDTANKVKADFVVIGLRRRSPVGKLLLGSTAQRILMDSPCPVITVKAP